MASRLKTRLSAGAAVLTGLGMVGMAAAAPAQADVSADLQYTCSGTLTDISGDFPDPWSIELTVSGEDEVDTGTAIPAPAITAEVTVTPGDDGHQALDDMNIESLSGAANTTYTFDGEDRDADLTFADIAIPDQGDVTAVATGTGTAETAPDAAGTVDIVAGDFTAALKTQDGRNLNITCTPPVDAAIGSITVVEADDGDGGDSGEPGEGDGDDGVVEPSDWFTEPGSLPITEDGKDFTVGGTATQDGVLNIVLLDADKTVLKTTPWNVTEGTNSQNFPFAEGTDYVRLISEDCMDADGNDGTVAGGGRNVEYYAPWVNPDGDDTGAGAEEPEIPGKVQTDGVTPQSDTAATLALGSLLLAGVGTAVVLVARRRPAQN